jgi:hypothetical protein
LVLIVGLAGIQFIPVSLNQSNIIPKEDIINAYEPPKEIANILKSSCYDCHSNNTIYPWYSKLQPLAWLMEKHIREGKDELNLNEFTSYSIRRQRSKLKSVISQVKKDEMPLNQYTLMHKDAILSDQMKTQLISWIEQLKDSI